MIPLLPPRAQQLPLFGFLFVAVFTFQGRAQETDPGTALAGAEGLYREGSYELSRREYEALRDLELSEAQRLWIDFRLADCRWRAQAATSQTDDTELEEARSELESLSRQLEEKEPIEGARPSVYAEIQESLGDWWWTRRRSRNWGPAGERYTKAMDWWAGCSRIDEARDRYLSIVWKIAAPPWRQKHHVYGSYGAQLPASTLENVIRIATEPRDKAHAWYLLGMTLRSQGPMPHAAQRIRIAFEKALEVGSRTEWYDDALYHYAEWLKDQGPVVYDDEGGWRHEPDFVKALTLYRRLTEEYEQGETRHFRRAERRITEITKRQVSVTVPNVFLPDAKIRMQLGWRNVETVELEVYALDLLRHIDLAGKDRDPYRWLPHVDVTRLEKVKCWTKDTGDSGEHRPGEKTLRLDELKEVDGDGKDLPRGAYLVVARADEATARDVLLISDATVVVKSSKDKALVYFADALSGSPIAGAEVKAWERFRVDRVWQWREYEGSTDKNGLFELPTTDAYGQHRFLVTARKGDRQAFSRGDTYRRRNPGQRWKIYAFTDRPAYRPGDIVEWKAMARQYKDFEHSTPAGAALEYEILDPHGAKVDSGELQLDDFGNAWSSFGLAVEHALGPYRVVFREKGEKGTVGNATLFRLEEYKLPEFFVTVKTPEKEGKKKTFRLGENVEVTIASQYYFGAPVADAEVEVFVYRKPYYRRWRPHRPYAWFLDEESERHSGGGELVKRHSLRSNDSGEATFFIATPVESGDDLEYRIEARVTDASRREISGGGSVRVTRQRYSVHLSSRHNLHHPQDRVEIDVRAEDGGGEPVAVKGRVTVTRERWTETWMDPSGKEIGGDELPGTTRVHGQVVPPGPGWRPVFQGYRAETVLTREIRTNDQGGATVQFTPGKEGYYKLTWTSSDAQEGEDPSTLPPIVASTTVWAATQQSAELGYRRGDVEVIVDKDTFASGEKAAIMLATATPDRWVLFTVEADGILEHRLVHVEGRVRLIHLDIGARHVPNIHLSAALVSERQLHIDSKQVKVPPVEQFLEVAVSPAEADWLPGEETTLTVSARDHSGKPVAAQVAIAVVDEAVFAIQSEYAGDPRSFFFSGRRGAARRPRSTFQEKTYLSRKESLAVAAAAQPGSHEYFYGQQLRQTLGGGAAGAWGGAITLSAQMEAGESLRMLGAPSSSRYAVPASGVDLAFEDAGTDAEKNAHDVSGTDPAVVVRTDFRATAFWAPDILTGADGTATVKVRFPQSLTRWKATARAATKESRFGIATARHRTRQPLTVALQAPRFFLGGDRLAVTAVVHNQTEAPVSVESKLESAGITVIGVIVSGQVQAGPPAPVTVRASGEARIDWLVEVPHPTGRGVRDAKLRVEVRGAGRADAMEKTFPVYERGIEQFLAYSGKLRTNDATVRVELPKERRAETTALSVHVTPSLAVTMLDALPYLIDYPYGCTEQTLSRFVPAVITLKTLRDLGLSRETVATRLFGGIEPAFGEETHPRGKKDLAELDRMVTAGLERLYDFQHSDGGWAWWKEGESDRFMTAYVVWGLALAREADVRLREGVLENGTVFLQKVLVEAEEEPDLQAWMLHALSTAAITADRRDATPLEEKAFQNLWARRAGLNGYGRALLAMSAHHFEHQREAEVLIRNLADGVQWDRRPDKSLIEQTERVAGEGVVATAHWGEDGIHHRWSEGGVEATAFALRALLTVSPDNELVEPVAYWLIRNRRGSQWKNTRDTAITVLALNDYLRKSGELARAGACEVLVNDKPVAEFQWSAEDVLAAPSRFTVDSKHLVDGVNEIRIRRTSTGAGKAAPLYFSAEARFFTQERPIPAAGHELFVRREYFKLVARPTLLKGHVHDRVPLKDGDDVTSGERVEVVLHIETKNHAEYLVFEDLKPAGLEAVEVRSGSHAVARELKRGAVDRRFGADAITSAAALESSRLTGRTRRVWQELRDRKVALFIDKLPQGIWELRYTLRAEAPGTFQALPVLAHAMYVPEIRANSQETTVTVKDRERTAYVVK